MYSRAELAELIVNATATDDPGPLLRVAVKASLSDRTAFYAALISARSALERFSRSALRRSFRALARMGHADSLTGLLASGSRDTRLAVVHALLNFGDHSHLSALEGLLSDSDADVRMQAQEAVRTIRDPSRVLPVQEVPGGSLTDDDRLIARLLLGVVPSASDTAGIAGLLFAESRSVRALARTSLGPLRDPVRDDLIAAIDAAVVSGRQLTAEAADVVKDVGDSRAARVLMRALESSPVARGHAQLGLLAMGPAAGQTLLDAFTTAPLTLSDGRLIAKAAGAIARDVLVSALDSPFRAVRDTAVAGLIELGTASVQPLLAILRQSGDRPLVEALLVLEHLAPKEAFASILQHARSTDPVIRTAAVRALAKFDHPDADAVVRAATAAQDWRVREAAVAVLGHRDWHNRDAVGRLSDAAVGDPHHRVRLRASESLSRIASSRDRPSAAYDSTGALRLEQHAGELLDALARGDEAAQTDARRELYQLRGLLAAYLDEPRVSSPAGSERRLRLKEVVQQFVDLTAYPFSAARRSSQGARTEAGQQGAVVRDDFRSAEIPHPISDDVRFSVTSSITVARQQPCVLDVWAHTTDSYEAVLEYVRRDPRLANDASLRTKGPVPVARGTTLVVSVTVPDLQWSDEDFVYWAGTIGNATFSFTVPADAREGDHEGQARIYVAGIQVARVSFLIGVTATRGRVHDVTSRQRRVSTAFASYATEDRGDVLARIQGMLSIVPDLDIFMDVVSLRSGEQWQERVEAEIGARDAFYLFWSAAARASTWVEREWRIALKTKGLHAIDPVPLQTPDQAPPPPELATLHFNEWTLQLRH